MNEKQKAKAKEILIFLESKWKGSENSREIIGEKWIDEDIFQIMYQLGGIVDGMYDEVKVE